MKKYGIIGSRRKNSSESYDLLEKHFLSLYKEGDEIVSGGCPKGGDRFAEIIARKYGIPIKIYYANWKKHGKAGGFVRNTYIAQDSDVILALVADDRTGGTEDTIKKAKKMGKEIVLLSDNENIKSQESDKNEKTNQSDAFDFLKDIF